jgi:hypothetical protein
MVHRTNSGFSSLRLILIGAALAVRSDMVTATPFGDWISLPSLMASEPYVYLRSSVAS